MPLPTCAKRFIPVWKQAPLLRYLLPLMAGIIMQWYWPLNVFWLAIITTANIVAVLFLLFTRFKSTPWFGGIVLPVFIWFGCWLVHVKDQRRWTDFIGKHYTDSAVLIAALQEPLVAKTKSFKAIASVELVDRYGNRKALYGDIIIYIQKDSLGVAPALQYGSRIILNKPLQPITNAGNPGGFDYQRHSAFHGIYYQVFLKADEYRPATNLVRNPFQASLYKTRDWIISVFKQYIPGSIENGVAAALLTGYRDDLDKALVEQYANTGVVHIIAISGMHLGLIYGLLFLLFKNMRKTRWLLVLRATVIIGLLWTFSFLTGAAPSITRSAIMFSVIVLGESFFRKGSIYNSLAVSAFLLLLQNPFNIWDVGFQLSYAAVLSIAIFGKPVYNWWRPQNKILRSIWQLNSVTLAAQILTLPFVVYHFHQFPLYFMLSNLVAVPLSSAVLYVLLALLALSWVPAAAKCTGWLAEKGIWLMDEYIGWVDRLPGSRIGDIYYTIPQALMLMAVLSFAGLWLLQQRRQAAVLAAFCFLLFGGLRSLHYWETCHQQKLIIYHVPQRQAIDIIQGRSYSFMGDDDLVEKGFLQNFHLLPSRILHQASLHAVLAKPADAAITLQLGKLSLLVLDKPVDLQQAKLIETDILLISKNIRTKPGRLLQFIHPKIIVADGSNSRWRVAQWKRTADSLKIPFHNVAERGAFETAF